ncbi:MAG: beta-ketoacyl-ACP synthase I [Polyangiaceae bacterium]|nr:beta-ketoacyl-ACP synthase I [Polyangiaceae bacterium]
MKRVVITGMGVVSSLGNNKQEVLASLQNGTSGIEFMPEYRDLELHCQIAGTVDIDTKARVKHKVRRFMGEAAAYSYIAMEEAIEDAGLEEHDVSSPRTGLIVGSASGAPSKAIEASELFKVKGLRKLGPYRITQTMNSSVSACLTTPFRIQGISYSMSSACATSSHCIGSALDQIQMGRADVMFAGGGEEVNWRLSCLFDAMHALSTGYNDTPQEASRPYDKTRDGFVGSGGGGILVLEELEHAKARGANIYAELVAYGATSDGYSMVSPSGDGAARCMKQALGALDGPVNYINAHATSTPVGDVIELGAIRTAFGAEIPPISSTKSLSGHALGAAGVHEAIYSLMMQRHGFIAASANISELDPEAVGMPIVTETQETTDMQRVMTNSFGFGGTNVSLVFQKFEG